MSQPEVEQFEELRAAGLSEAEAQGTVWPEHWTPATSEGETLTLATIIGQACGTASMCWDETPTGVFDSARASWVVDGALAAIKKLEHG